MKKYVLNNDNRNEMMKEFLCDLYMDYTKDKFKRVVIFDCTILELSINGIASVQTIINTINKMGVHMLEFKDTNIQKGITVLVDTISLIEYDIDNKLINITSDNKVISITL